MPHLVFGFILIDDEFCSDFWRSNTSTLRTRSKQKCRFQSRPSNSDDTHPAADTSARDHDFAADRVVEQEGSGQPAAGSEQAGQEERAPRDQTVTRDISSAGIEKNQWQRRRRQSDAGKGEAAPRE